MKNLVGPNALYEKLMDSGVHPPLKVSFHEVFPLCLSSFCDKLSIRIIQFQYAVVFKLNMETIVEEYEQVVIPRGHYLYIQYSPAYDCN